MEPAIHIDWRNPSRRSFLCEPAPDYRTRVGGWVNCVGVDDWVEQIKNVDSGIV